MKQKHNYNKFDRNKLDKMSGKNKFSSLAEEIENQEKKMNNIEKGITQIRENMLSIARSDVKSEQQNPAVNSDKQNLVKSDKQADISNDLSKLMKDISIESLIENECQVEKDEKDILLDPENLFAEFEKELADDDSDEGDFFELIGEVTSSESLGKKSK